MRILFITPPPYLPNRLHRIRSFELIKILAKKYDVHLFSVITEAKQYAEFNEIEKVCKSITIVKINKLLAYFNCLLFFYLPVEVAFCYSSNAKEKMRRIIKKHRIDLLYIKRLRSTIFTPQVKIKTILDTTDAMSMFYLRMYENKKFPTNMFYLFEAIKYRFYEKKSLNQFSHVITCSDIDKGYLQSINSTVPISTIPNPVDTNYFSHKNNQTIIKNSLLFRGLMDKQVNIDAIQFFIDNIFPKVLRKIKNAKLYIVGPNPAKIIRNFHNMKNIFVMGYIDDVGKMINQTSISICPIRIGSGTRHKIIQAWAMRKPVVSTSMGAEGLQYINDNNIIVRDTPQEFADGIVELLKNRKKAEFIAENGFITARSKYSNKTISQKLCTLINHL